MRPSRALVRVYPLVVLDHIVVVADSLSIDGGSAKVAMGSALALAQRGLQVTIFAASGQASDELASCENVTIVSTEQPDVLAARNKFAAAVRGIWNRRAYSAMGRLLATLDPARTVVHVHCWTKALSSSVVGSIVNAKFPVVLTVHEYFSACPTGCLYFHADRQVCNLVPMSAACILKDCDSRSYAFKLYRVLRQWITRAFGRMPTGVKEYITVSDFSRRVIEPFLPRKHRIHPLGNPVDAVRAPRVDVTANDTVAYIGRLSAEKGCALLAEAARLAGVKVLFIGDGPDRAAVEQANPAAEITGWLDAADVSRHVRRARCVVVPSLWYETFGLVVLEAAALGIPAIVPDGTAPRDLVVNGETGLAFERGNVADLAAQLRAVCDDATAGRMGRAAYEKYWADPPTMTSHVDRLVAAYNDILREAALKPAPSL